MLILDKHLITFILILFHVTETDELIRLWRVYVSLRMIPRSCWRLMKVRDLGFKLLVIQVVTTYNNQIVSHILPSSSIPLLHLLTADDILAIFSLGLPQGPLGFWRKVFVLIFVWSFVLILFLNYVQILKILSNLNLFNLENIHSSLNLSNLLSFSLRKLTQLRWARFI